MEMLMQYVWNSRLLMMPMVTTKGLRVEVVDPGLQNNGAGPDFFNAKIIIDGTLWAGNVEMHVKASDWHLHGHDTDPTYNNVVLHVVAISDTHILMPDGRELPQVVMKDFTRFKARFQAALSTPGRRLACGGRLSLLDGLRRTDWIDRMGIERLQHRAGEVNSLIQAHGGDRDYAAYVMLARALGFGINAQPMEHTARSINPRWLMLQSDSQLQVEAMLMGQSGLLGDTPVDYYHKQLIDEYKFLAKKYDLTPILAAEWKTGGIRPANMPLRRLSLLANYVRHHVPRCTTLLEVRTVDDARRLFDITTGLYWQTHTAPGQTAPKISGALSSASVNLLIINVVVPMLYAMGLSMADSTITDSAVNILYGLKAETNNAIKNFEDCGMKIDSAFCSQALLHLYREYCTAKRCLSCRWAHHLIARPILHNQATPDF